MKVLEALILFSHLANTLSNEIISLDLQPTPSLLHEVGNDHRRLTSDNTNEYEADTSHSHARLLMHPYNSAVYSALVEVDDFGEGDSDTPSSMVEQHNQKVREFNEHRHLSRHEMFQMEQDAIADNRLANEERSLRRNLQIQEFRQEGTEFKDGGLYNEFQSAPLSQG